MKLDKGLAKGIVKISFVVLLLAVFGFFVFNFVLPVFANGATIWTDKPDYDPEETVYISGSGFNPSSTIININITRPDGVDVCPVNGKCGELPVTNDSGSFSNYAYLLNGIEGTYTVTASDGINSAQTSFTDTRTITGATLNDGSSVTVKGGTSITAAVTVKTTGWGSDNDWRCLKWQIGTGSTHNVDFEPDYSSNGTYTKSFLITAPASEGKYDFKVWVYSNDGCSSGQTGPTTLTNGITVDNTPPTGGSITYTDGYYTSTSVPITYTLGTDTGSGLNTASGKIQRSSATLSGGSCDTFGSFSDLVTESDGSYTDTSVTSGNCYKYQYVISDNAGNTATYTSANIAKIAICGNGNKEGPEVCDLNSQSCIVGGYAGTQSCSGDCSGWNTCVATESCGDGIVNNGEACDDTNINNGDGCSDVCAVESGYTCSGEPSVCNPTARYVATTGADSGNCIPSAPCKTITYAIGQASEGETVHVAAGTYNEQLNINKNNLLMKSDSGAASTIITPTDTTNGGIVLSGNGNTIDGFKIKDFTDSPNENKVIRINSNNNVIKNNIIQGNLKKPGVLDQTEYGILFQSTASGNLIENNEVYDIGYMGVNIASDLGTHNNTIRNNNIHDIGIYAIGVDRSPDNTVTGNTISNLIGGTLRGGSYPCQTWCWGVIVWGAASTGTVIDNQDLMNLPNGIALSAAQGVTVNNSEIGNNQYIGIKLSDSSWIPNSTDNNVIENNEIHDNQEGIVITSGGYGGIGANNRINNNKIYSNTAGPTGLHNYVSQIINAENNWWGSSSGPYHSTLNPTGKGANVSDNVDFAPWTTENEVEDVQTGEEYVLSPEVKINFTSTTENGSVTFSDSNCSSSPTVFSVAGRCYEINSNMTDGSFTAEVTLYYDDANDDGIVDGTGINESYLAVYYNDGAGWVSVPESDVLERNTAANYIKIRVTHLTGFSLSPSMDVTGYDITPDWAKGSQTNIGILDLNFTNTGLLGDTITQVKVTSQNTNYFTDIQWVKLWDDIDNDGVFEPTTDTLLGSQPGILFFPLGTITFGPLAVLVPASGAKHLFVSYDTFVTAGNGNTLDASIAAGDITMLNSGTNVGALDPAGSATLDTVAPTVGITTAPGIYKGTIDLGATATDTGSGVQKVEFYKGVPTTGYLGEDATPSYSYSWATAPADDGTYTIWVRGYDNVGNYVDVDTVTITVDNSKPVTVLDPIATPTAINSFSVTGTSTDATTNVVNVQWKYSTESLWSATVPSDGAFGDQKTEGFNFNVGPLSDGEYTVNVRATDQAGNVEDPVSATFCIDRTAPPASNKPTHSDDANPGYDNDYSLDFSWNAVTDIGCAGLSHYNVYVWDSVSGTYGLPINNGLSTSYTKAGASENVYYKIKVTAVDNANNEGLASPESDQILVDTILPTISSIVFTPSDPSKDNTPLLEFNVDDDGSGIDLSTIAVSDGTNTYRTSTSPAIVCTGPVSGTYSCSITWSTLADGDYSFTFDVDDLAGNSATTQTVTAYTVDTVKPTTSDDAPSGWQTATFTVTLTPSDPALSSGIAWTKYCVDTDNICVPDIVGTSRLFNIDGQYYLRYHSADNAGNVQDVVSKFVQLDTVKPTTTDDTNPATPWYATDRTVTLTCSDATSGCADTYYCVDAGGICIPATLGTSVSVTCPIDDVCQQYVRYYSVDVAGNNEVVKTSNVIKIDKEKPTGYSLTVDSVATTEYMAGTVTVRCNGATTDGSGSGVDVDTYDFEYSLDGSWAAMPGCTDTVSSCSWDTTAITDVSSSLRCMVDDNVGNTGDWAQEDYAGIDNTKPTSAIVYPADGEWLSSLVEVSPITISGTAFDANSGLQKVEIQINVGGWNLATGTASWTYSWALPADGTYTISSRATDNAKPVSNVQDPVTQITVYVDSTKPTVSITLPASLPDATAGWYKGTISISHTETDNMALDNCEYRYNGGSWSAITCNTPFIFDTTLCSDGTNSCAIDVRAWDLADNSFTDSVTFSVDNSAPIITSVLLSDNTVKEGTIITITSDGTDPQTLKSCQAFTYDSLGDLIAGSEQALDSGCDGPYTLPTGIPDGTYQIRVRARNHAGTDSWASSGIIVDDTSPTIANTAVSDSIVQSGTVVKITTRITDNLAGVDPATTKAHIQNPDGNDVTVVSLVDDGSDCDVTPGDSNYCGSWTAAGVEGTYYVDITADDNAGNSQTQNNGATIIVDNTQPVISYVFSGKNWVGLGQTFYVDAPASDNIGFDSPTYCTVGINDGSGFRPIDSILYSPVTGKCSGYVTVNDTFNNEGSASLIVIVQDAAGNSGQQKTGIGIDNTKPVATITTIPSPTSLIKSDDVISFNINFLENMSGMGESCEISLNNTGAQTWLINSSDNTCSGNYVVLRGLNDGYVEFVLRAKDAAGNLLANDSVNFRLDNNAPLMTIIQPVPAYYSNWLPIEVNVTDWPAGVDDSSVVFRIYHHWGFWDFVDANGTLNNSAKPTYTYNVDISGLTEDTQYYLGIKASDLLGHTNLTYWTSISFGIDHTPPTWPSGAKLTVTYSPYDKDGNVKLSWPAATDALSGVDHYNVYVYNATGYLLSNSTNQTTFDIFLEKDGLYTFNVTAVDKAKPSGNENSGLIGTTTVDRSCTVEGTCTPSAPVPTSSGGGGGGWFLSPTTTTVPPAVTTTTQPTGQTTATTLPSPTTTTQPSAPPAITGLVALIAGNTVYQAVIALAAAAALLTVFRYKWVSKDGRKGAALFSWIFDKLKNQKKILRKSRK